MRPLLLILVFACCCAAMTPGDGSNSYRDRYDARLADLDEQLRALHELIRATDASVPDDKEAIAASIHEARTALKAFDLWARYLDPINHRRINGPLPVEWETEVFEKYEKPYRREGAGLTLAELYLEEPGSTRDSLLRLVDAAISALGSYHADSVTVHLATPDHFLFCNRLMLLNLAAIYTTGFECPDTARVIPELRNMLRELRASTDAFNASFPSFAYDAIYEERLHDLIAFVEEEPDAYSAFDHFRFLRQHVGPLFTLNQEHIRRTNARSRSWMDYSLNNNARTLFAKDLYIGQDAKGVFRRVEDPDALADIRRLGHTLFIDPILSGNNERSCASCHRPDMCFTDTSCRTAPAFDHQGRLPRNTPSLVNADLNHLLMLDGRHIGMLAQAKDVLTAPTEMGGCAQEALDKVMDCPGYRRDLNALLPLTPTYEKVTVDHLLSSITCYVASLGAYASSFDEAMNGIRKASEEEQAGFNLFMSRAQCATCHFVPHFNGVKPPYIGSEFEVIGVPEDEAYASLSVDVGRAVVNPAPETQHAFRTGGLRNIARSAPYMHNGVFRSLREVIDLYDGGGGAGRGLDVPNQTLSSDSLHLSEADKSRLEAFMRALNEDIPAQDTPALPASRKKESNPRTPGGTY